MSVQGTGVPRGTPVRRTAVCCATMGDNRATAAPHAIGREFVSMGSFPRIQAEEIEIPGWRFGYESRVALGINVLSARRVVLHRTEH